MFTCQSNDPSQFYTDLTIWLNLIPICTELVEVFHGKPFFLPTCSRYQIHSEITHDHDLGTNKKSLN